MQPALAQASFEGWKTVTRRTYKLESINESPDRFIYSGMEDFKHVFIDTITGKKTLIKSPYGLVGDVLYVRECWMARPSGGIIFRGDIERPGHKNAFKVKWCSAMLMPKKNARIHVEVVNVSAEQIQQITNDECLKEGIQRIAPTHTARELYRDYS
ncbi:MAG TPA: hypothetical protein VFJ43_02095, partial [Bacteroidia bacterium]|nr:hypothetical protein [Bacteroidia bacterium]